jgi:hypothetical protein
VINVIDKIRGVARGCAKGARAHPVEKKWLEGSTGLKTDPQGRQFFPLAGTPLGKFLATLLDKMYFSTAIKNISLYSLHREDMHDLEHVTILELVSISFLQFSIILLDRVCHTE